MVWPFSNTSGGASASTSAQSSQVKAATPQTQSIPPTTAPHDPDFYAAHPHLTPPSFSTQSSPPSSTNNASTPPAAAAAADEALDPSLPRTMSCRAAFDSAFYCSSLGGHFNDLYRYGQLRSCSDHWNDFWFCMRTKNSYSGRDVKERMVQDRYREKEVQLMSGPNSEDVWVRRGPGDEVRGAFGAVAEFEKGQGTR
ncbi:hypothetical protein NX059_007899 [Plenodomus lindquistii]|nr:hypothetical protein NX059_007899 [Plenodomus lindquistii]